MTGTSPSRNIFPTRYLPIPLLTHFVVASLTMHLERSMVMLLPFSTSIASSVPIGHGRSQRSTYESLQPCLCRIFYLVAAMRTVLHQPNNFSERLQVIQNFNVAIAAHSALGLLFLRVCTLCEATQSNSLNKYQ